MTVSIEAIRHRWSIATPGPWKVGADQHSVTDTNSYQVAAKVTQTDARAIARAPADIEAPLSAVEATRAYIRETDIHRRHEKFAVLLEKLEKLEEMS
jgi:hypothetical protein